MNIIFKNLPKKIAVGFLSLSSVMFATHTLAQTANSQTKTEALDHVNIQMDDEFAMPQVDAAALEVMNEICPQIIGKNKNFDANYSKFLQKTFPTVSNPKALVASFKSDPVYIEAYNQSKKDAASMSTEETRQACLEVATYEWPKDGQ